jgi:EpsD family peptidyl-prolyl cis-trans isomerase
MRLIAGLGLMVLVAGLSGCDQETVPAGQVLADVGSRELTARQLQDMLRALPPGRDPRDPAIRAEILRGLVDDTLLAQGAVNEKLDKRPDIARRIDAARRTILARAFAEEGLPRDVTQEDLGGYFASHPAQFEHRNRYDISELTVMGDDATRSKAVATLNAPGATLEGTADTLRKAGMRVGSGHYSTTSDRLPGPLADSFAKLQPGAFFTLRAGSIEHLGRIDHVTPDPVTFEQAAPTLRALVLQARLEAQRKTKLAALREKIPVIYGDLGSSILAGREDEVQGDLSSQQDWPH